MKMYPRRRDVRELAERMEEVLQMGTSRNGEFFRGWLNTVRDLMRHNQCTFEEAVLLVAGSEVPEEDDPEMLGNFPGN